MIDIGYKFKTTGAVVLATAPADKDSIIVLSKYDAQYVTGRVYVHQLPHPNGWDNGTYDDTVEAAVEHLIDRALFGTISSDQTQYLVRLVRNVEQHLASLLTVGSYVRTKVYGHRGRITRLHDRCPEGPGWLAGQQAPEMREYADGPWVSLLVHQGGSVTMPVPLVEVVEPFDFTNRHADRYFGVDA